VCGYRPPACTLRRPSPSVDGFTGNILGYIVFVGYRLGVITLARTLRKGVFVIRQKPRCGRGTRPRRPRSDECPASGTLRETEAQRDDILRIDRDTVVSLPTSFQATAALMPLLQEMVRRPEGADDDRRPRRRRLAGSRDMVSCVRTGAAMASMDDQIRSVAARTSEASGRTLTSLPC
jgi:hypothetical protein